MLCENCKQKEAKVHIQEIINGERKNLHICEECALKKGISPASPQGINIAEMLYKLSANKDFRIPFNGDLFPGMDLREGFAQRLLVCPSCKWDTGKFQKTGKLGCENCYNVFSETLSETLSMIHKSKLHIGKRPDENSTESSIIMLDLLTLQQRLEEHVKKEEFEAAAEIRDKINELKQRSKPTNKKQGKEVNG